MQKVKSGAKFRGRFIVECIRKGKLIWKEDVSNILTNQGLDHILDVVLHGTTPFSPWYCCLVETDTAPAAGMTYAVPTYTESEAYDEGTRPEYNEAASSSQSITNSANKAVFTINATKTMYGASIVSFATKGDTAQAGARLLCYAKFAASRSVVDDDVINLTYTLTAADDGV